MAWEQTQAQIDRLKAAVQRGADEKAQAASDLAAAKQEASTAEANLADADAQLAAVLTPVADQAEQAFPAPAPAPAPDPTATPPAA